MPVIVRDLRLRYPETGKVVLHGINLELRRGEVKLLLGPSGAGKSSLALTLNGLIPRQMDGEIRGDVLVNGKKTTDATVSWLTTQVGVLFQDPEAQIATLTVGDEVAFGMENLKLPPEVMAERSRDALRRVGLVGLEEQGTDTLSGGQKQRLALASTLAMGVSVLVFDEPTANLDPAGTSAFFASLAHLKAQGYTTLIVEHKLDELMSRVDSIAVLDWGGTITADGPPRRVLQEQAELLRKLGVWKPQVSELADALQERGTTLEPYPLTISECVTALERVIGERPLPLVAPESRGAINKIEKSGPPAVQVESLSYRYPDGTLALQEASLTIAEGDFYAIVGPNGSGKTTLARHLIALNRLQEGRVRILGEDVSRLSGKELNRRAAYIFQNPEHQFVALRVYDELAFSLRARKVSEEEIARRVNSLLAQFGLEEQREANPYNLSQGQKRRLSVATMLALEPRILILDEPTFGQDRSSASRIMEELKRLRSQGVTIIIITHDMKLVAEYASRVGVLIAGRVEFEGSVRELYAEGELLARGHLEVPPLYAVSRRIRESSPGFPLMMTVSEFTEEICALSDMRLAAASSTR
ncbi:MAG: ABC transporter ATP-binding protein [Chloroflexi bacterium]|nr:ABC transporter ATP-binding protein [Chloroflexota bacterium]